MKSYKVICLSAKNGDRLALRAVLLNWATQTGNDRKEVIRYTQK